MRYTVLAVIFLTGVVGCACDSSAPTSPSIKELPQASLSRPQQLEDSHRLWMEYIFYFDKEHNNVEVVPRREGRFHLNALKFLEEYCTNCLQITGIKNNGDGTIDLTVKITHPFTGYPEYTGFDVKGIIMFQGSHEFPDNLEKYPLYPQNFRASWRLLGDPELLNADGYSYRWSPWYDSGSSMPLFNYWQGKYASGTPTANVNGYLDFYSNENRHMFECNASVSRTYHIWLPQGPVVAGYAVDACWEPPLVTPVTNPLADFPVTANQPESYHFNVVINDGNPVTDQECCNLTGYKCHETRAEIDFWYPPPPPLESGSFVVGGWSPEIDYQKVGYATNECQDDGSPGWRSGLPIMFTPEQNGTHQFVAVEWHAWYHNPATWPETCVFPAICLFEVVVDIPK